MIHYKSQSSMRSFYSLIFISLGSAVYSVQCLFHACLAAGIAVAVSETLEREELDKLTRHPSVYFNGFGSCLSFLLVFRANLSYQRYWEAATRITQLISKLRDVAIQVATFVQSNDEDAASWKSTQLRRLALYNALVLMDLRGGADLNQFVKEGILTEDEKPVLQATGDKASLVMVWLTDGWVVREMAQGINVPPPVLSRAFQLLSEASLEQHQILKIRDTPFPFPFGQVCSLMLLIWCLTLPVVLSTYIETTWIAALGSFLGVASLFSVNCVASELESPFDDTPNDLALEYFKDDFTDTMAETMSWLADRSIGNVAGSLGAEPTEKPWMMMEKQMDVHRELSARVAADKDFDNPVASASFNFIPEDVRMRVTRGQFTSSEITMSTFSRLTSKHGVFWLH